MQGIVLVNVYFKDVHLFTNLLQCWKLYLKLKSAYLQVLLSEKKNHDFHQYQ